MRGTRSFHLLEDCSLLFFPESAAGTSGSHTMGCVGSCQSKFLLPGFFFSHWAQPVLPSMRQSDNHSQANLSGMEIKECHMLLMCESHLPCLELGICALRSVFLKCRCVSKMQSWNKSELCFLKTVTLNTLFLSKRRLTKMMWDHVFSVERVMKFHQ